MKKLGYFEIDQTAMYLEFAPDGLVRKNNKAEVKKETETKPGEINLKQS